jgi:hypothetical protein
MDGSPIFGLPMEEKNIWLNKLPENTKNIPE